MSSSYSSTSTSIFPSIESSTSSQILPTNSSDIKLNKNDIIIIGIKKKDVVYCFEKNELLNLIQLPSFVIKYFNLNDKIDIIKNTTKDLLFEYNNGEIIQKDLVDYCLNMKKMRDLDKETSELLNEQLLPEIYKHELIPFIEPYENYKNLLTLKVDNKNNIDMVGLIKSSLMKEDFLILNVLLERRVINDPLLKVAYENQGIVEFIVDLTLNRKYDSILWMFYNINSLPINDIIFCKLIEGNANLGFLKKIVKLYGTDTYKEDHEDWSESIIVYAIRNKVKYNNNLDIIKWLITDLKINLFNDRIDQYLSNFADYETMGYFSENTKYGFKITNDFIISLWNNNNLIPFSRLFRNIRYGSNNFNILRIFALVRYDNMFVTLMYEYGAISIDEIVQIFCYGIQKDDEYLTNIVDLYKFMKANGIFNKLNNNQKEKIKDFVLDELEENYQDNIINIVTELKNFLI